MAKVLLTTAQAQAKWLAGIQNSSTNATTGVNNVTTAPGQLAAAQQAYWLQRVTAAATKWATNVGAVTLADWKTAMIQRGIPNMQTGAQAKQNKYGTFYAAYASFLQGEMQTIAAMPKGGRANALARSAAMINASMDWAAART